MVSGTAVTAMKALIPSVRPARARARAPARALVFTTICPAGFSPLAVADSTSSSGAVISFISDGSPQWHNGNSVARRVEQQHRRHPVGETQPQQAVADPGQTAEQAGRGHLAGRAAARPVLVERAEHETGAADDGRGGPLVPG